MRHRSRLLMIAVIFGSLTLGVMGLMAPSASAGPQGQFCGGFAGIQCPTGYTCVDVPGDGCDPHHGGADCAGYCKRSH
jgi:hypothetical protein